MRQVPTTVSSSTLGEILTPRNDIVRPGEAVGQARFVGLEHIESGSGRRIGESSVKLESLTGRKAQFKSGDILYGYLRPYLNKVWLADFDGTCSVEQYVFQVDEDRAVPEFVRYFLLSPVYLARAPIDDSPGQLPRIRASEVASVPITLPSRREQGEIVRRLDRAWLAIADIEAASAMRSREIASLWDSYLVDAFSGLMPIADGRGTHDAPPGWTWQRLGDLAQMESGHTPSRRRPEWWGGDVPWIALPDIREVDGRRITRTLETTNQLGIDNSSARILPAGTVVLSRTASVGYTAVMARPMATSQDFVNWVCGPNLDPTFLCFLFQRARPALRALSSGAIHKTVYVPTFKQLQVCIPDLDHQRKIASRLSAIQPRVDELRFANVQQTHAVETLRSSALAEVFERL